MKLSELTKALAERALTTEMDIHLDEERAEDEPDGHNHPPNRRNGRSQKTVTTASGKVVLDIPRDRNATFDPLLIAKYQRRFPEFDRKIVSIYARGMTPREIQGHIEEIYGVEASPQHPGRDQPLLSRRAQNTQELTCGMPFSVEFLYFAAKEGMPGIVNLEDSPDAGYRRAGLKIRQNHNSGRA